MINTKMNYYSQTTIFINWKSMFQCKIYVGASLIYLIFILGLVIFFVKNYTFLLWLNINTSFSFFVSVILGLKYIDFYFFESN